MNNGQKKVPGRVAGKYLQSIIDGLEDELIVIDKDYHIIHANRAVLKRHDKRKNEVVGQYCYDISHGRPELCHPPRPECPITHVWETNKPARATHMHLYGNDGNQSKRYIDVIASPVYDSDGKVLYVAEVLRDVTEAKELELQLAEANQTLFALNAISNEVSQSLDMDVVLSNALDKTLEVLKANRGGIMLWDEKGEMLRYRVHRGLSAKYIKAITLGQGQGVAGLAASTGKAILIEDITTDKRAAMRDILKAEGLHGFASIPIILKGKTLGVLNVVSQEVRRFSEQDLKLLESITAHIAMAIENARLHEQVQKQDEVRGELLSQLFSIQEDERRRIARELHDETMQSLVAMAASLDAVAESMPADQKAIKRKLKSLKSVSLGILDETHRLIYELRPSVLDDFGLVSAVRSHMEQELKPARIKAEFKVMGKQKRLSSRLENTLFRAIQEAINNVARHSGASNCTTVLHFGKKTVKVNIKDDGKGFDVKEAMNTQHLPRGLGLLGMQERMSLVNGALAIVSEQRHGTEIVMEVPMVEGENE